MSNNQNHRKRTIWIIVVVVGSAAIASGWGLRGLFSRQVSAVQPQKNRISVRDSRPVAEAIVSLETRFSQVITYEDVPLVHSDDTLDVTESVRRDLHKYDPGKAPKVIIPRGGEISVEFTRNDAVEVVLSSVLNEFERMTPSTSFRIVETNGVIHVIPQSIKGPTGETIPVSSILDAPVQLPAQERTGMQLLEAWANAVTTSSRKRIIIGATPLKMLLTYKDDQGLNSPNARDALTEILSRVGKEVKLSWQLFYDPGQKIYAINIHRVQ
jgi:hypothetical protein